ncbi:MAG: TetR family transcriptional regulator [Bacteroidetes bacterium]|nr:MAG: TetR family transcriptional regulator [Bacteroidota bacterium]
MDFTKRQIEIIGAATELIGEKGVQNLTTKNLASKMSFSEPALYRHFKGKTEILKSVLVFFKEFLGKKINEIFNLKITGIEKIEKMIEFQFNHFYNNPAIVMVIFSETSFQYDTVLSKVVSEIISKKRENVVRIIESGQTDGSIRKDIPAEQIATIVMGSMRLTILEWRLSNFKFNLIERGEELIGTVRTMIRKK